MPDIVITPASNLIDSTGGTFTIRTADAQALSLKTNNSDALYIKSDGNVGIGTTNPDSKLMVANPSVAGLRIGFLGASQNIYDADVQFFRSGGGTEYMRLYYGNLGIGTTSVPTVLTTYVGSGAITGTNDGLRLQVASYNNAARNTIVWAQDSGGTVLGRYGLEWNSTTSQMNFVWRDVYNAGAGSTELMRFTGGGNLGIGTSNPGAKFEIKDGDIWLNGASSASNPEIRFIDDSGISVAGAKIRYGNYDGNLYIEHIYDYSTSGIFFRNRTAGTSLNTLSLVNGNVGIGTTSPTLSSGKGLHINSDSGHANLKLQSSGRTWEMLSTTVGYFSLYDTTGATDRLSVSTAGNVGIGTTSPTQKLEVRGYVLSDLGAGVESGFYLGNSGHGTRRPAGTNDVYLYTSAGTVYLGANGNSSQHITINNSGNVGIGTTSPSSKFHVQNGNITLAATNIRNDWSSVVWNIAQWSSNTTTTPAYYMGFETDVANNRRFYISNKDNDVPNGGDPNGAIIFRTGTGPSERMVIAYGGNVGIGTTSPAYPLDVNGSCHASSFPTSSDKRFKKKIKPLENSLEKIKKVNGVSYEWNEFINERRNGYDLNSTIIGVIAQEVEEIFPEIVTRWKLSDDCKDALAVDYPRFVPVLIEAIKEQQNIIENQNKKIDNLIARISVLESKLE